MSFNFITTDVLATSGIDFPDSFVAPETEYKVHSVPGNYERHYSGFEISKETYEDILGEIIVKNTLSIIILDSKNNAAHFSLVKSPYTEMVSTPDPTDPNAPPVITYESKSKYYIALITWSPSYVFDTTTIKLDKYYVYP